MILTTHQFTLATPEQKEQQMIAHFELVTTEMLQLKIKMRKLKGWLEAYPKLHSTNNATLNKPLHFSHRMEMLSRQMDELTRECVNVAVEHNELAKYLLTINPDNL